MNSNEVQQGWERAEEIAPAALREARLQLHHALQLVADAGRKLASSRDAEWAPELRALATPPIRASRTFRVGVAVADLAVVVAGEKGEPIGRFDLAGRTLAEAVAWLRESLAGLGADGAKVTGKPTWEPPDHKLTTGAAFAPPADALRRLATYYANAWRVLTYVSEITPDASPPRCALETLDYAASVAFDDDKQIDVGFRPGDAELEEPFFYVALSPPPVLDEDEVDELEELEGGGEWRTEEGFAAVQPASAYTLYDAEPVQAASTTAFFDSALEQGRALLGLAEA